MTRPMSEEREKLEPCPFCGPGQSVVSLWYDDASKAQRVGCGRCGVSTGIRPRSEERTAANAIAAWNTRSTSSAERGMREALERLLPFLDDLDEGADSIGVYPDTACSQECREAVAAARAALSSKGEG